MHNGYFFTVWTAQSIPPACLPLLTLMCCSCVQFDCFWMYFLNAFLLWFCLSNFSPSLSFYQCASDNWLGDFCSEAMIKTGTQSVYISSHCVSSHVLNHTWKTFSSPTAFHCASAFCLWCFFHGSNIFCDVRFEKVCFWFQPKTKTFASFTQTPVESVYIRQVTVQNTLLLSLSFMVS